MSILSLLGFNEMFKEPQISEELNENYHIGAPGPNISLDSLAGVPEGNFIGDSFFDTGGVFGRYLNQAGTLEIERGYIQQQRSISILPEVAIGIEEIMKDLFVLDDPLTLEVSSDGKNPDYLYEHFDNFKRKPFRVVGDSKTPPHLLLFNLLRQVYVDGHMIVLVAEVNKKEVLLDPERHPYEDWKIKSKEPRIVVPNTERHNILNEDVLKRSSMVHGFDIPKNRVKDNDFDLDNLNEDMLEEIIIESSKSKTSKDKQIIFIPLDPARIQVNNANNELRYDIRRGHSVVLDKEKIIMADFGLFDIMGARYGFLQYAFKYANQLQTLQDMLIPMRFRRSVARRIFNVDVGNLPQGRAAEYMKETQNKFRYKKHYDVKNGKIVSENRENVGIVEDYWFANRSGSKGTTVEMMDEAGNFSDSLEDIAYFNKKLYQSMFIPLRRVFESDADYDYTASSIEVDEERFQRFLARLRFVFNNVFTEMFRHYLRSFGLDDEDVNRCEVQLRFDNWFEKNKAFEKFEKSLGIHQDAMEFLGKAYSAETMMRMVWDKSPEDVREEIEKIKAELEEDNIYHIFYVMKEEQ